MVINNILLLVFAWPTSRRPSVLIRSFTKSLEEKQIWGTLIAWVDIKPRRIWHPVKCHLDSDRTETCPALRLRTYHPTAFFCSKVGWMSLSRVPLDPYPEEINFILQISSNTYIYIYIYPIYPICEFVAPAFWGSTFSLPHLSTQPSSTTSYHCLNYLNFIWMESEDAELWNIGFSQTVLVPDWYECLHPFGHLLWLVLHSAWTVDGLTP